MNTRKASIPKQLYWRLREWFLGRERRSAAARPWQHPAVRYHCDWVLDVGANTGQYRATLRRQGYTGDILSFEPLSDAHARLCVKATEDPRWEIYPRCALGRAAGETSIHIAGNSVSSSLLPMLELHASAAPDSIYIGSELTPVKTLDAALAGRAIAQRRVYLKIDTQGFEAEVLAGARATLSAVQALELEVSLRPLYADQPTWQDLSDVLRDAGFVLTEIHNAFSDPRSGELLQIDACFARPRFKPTEG